MNYNKYGETAIIAVEYLNRISSLTPSEAWDKAASEMFGRNTSSQKKQCPKDTFLAICETGRIKGVKPGNYTNSVKNKNYALEAIDLLEQNDKKYNTKMELWRAIPECSQLVHNSQMDVALALFKSQFFIKS